jgi:hypothetical protein
MVRLLLIAQIHASLTERNVVVVEDDTTPSSPPRPIIITSLSL